MASKKGRIMAATATAGPGKGRGGPANKTMRTAITKAKTSHGAPRGPVNPRRIGGGTPKPGRLL